MMSIQSYETVEVSNPPKASELYKLGWNAYLNGDNPDTLTTADEKRGWKAASRAEGEYLTGNYAKNMRW